MTQSDAEAINRAFYDELYSGRSALGHLVRAAISFDQRSKAGPNIAAVKRAAAAHGSPSPSVLDYGCGWGTLLLMLSRWSGRLYGYDLSSEAVASLGRAMRLLNRELGAWSPDADEQPKIDVLVCSHVLEHVDNDAELLRSFRGWLGAGGHAVLNVPVNEVVADPKHVRAYTETSFLALTRDAGFEVVDVRQTDRWTSFFLRFEARGGRMRRALSRALRGVLAIPPWRVVDALGNGLLKRNHLPQQLIVVARVPGSA